MKAIGLTDKYLQQTLYIFFLAFAIFLLHTLVAPKKYCLQYKIITALFFMLHLFSYFFLVVFKLRGTPNKTMGLASLCFFFTSFFRGLTHSCVCSNTLSLSKQQVSILKPVTACTGLSTLILTLQYFIGTS